MDIVLVEQIGNIGDFIVSSATSGATWDVIKPLLYALLIEKSKNVKLNKKIESDLEDIEGLILEFDINGIQKKFASMKKRFIKEQEKRAAIGICELLFLAAFPNKDLIISKLEEVNILVVDINNPGLHLMHKFIESYVYVVIGDSNLKEKSIAKMSDIQNAFMLIDPQKSLAIEDELNLMKGIASFISTLSENGVSNSSEYQTVDTIFNQLEIKINDGESTIDRSVFNLILGIYHIRLFSLTKDREYLLKARNYFMSSYIEKDSNVITLSYYAFVDLLSGYTTEALSKLEKVQEKLNNSRLLNRVLLGKSICYFILGDKANLKKSIEPLSSHEILILEDQNFRNLVDLLKIEANHPLLT